jgi:SAM-dependent methyltransferase
LEKDRIKWNKRYIEKNHSRTPSDIVKNFYKLAPTGTSLDIAAGNGRNSLLLAQKGFMVDAVDISDVGLKNLDGVHPGTNRICADLDLFNIAENRYSLIINIKFLSRRLFPQILKGLVPGGVLIFETYMEKTGGNKSSMHRDYILMPNELLREFLSLNIIYYNVSSAAEKGNHVALASLVAVNNKI